MAQRYLKANWGNIIGTLSNQTDLQAALDALRKFYKEEKDTLVWAHATFDFPILANAYNAIKQGFAFPYRNLRDIRTLIDLSKLDYKKGKAGDLKTHNALEDCRFQVIYCTEAFKKLYELRT